ncbi:hypothetical protein PHYBLDRAFT_70593 [Phycomyces blakesleeanus NRRL 1555(-)]|uniref:Uncharacterized protein n=1 Tax=Phycomyces blakesleeanus (strain ATCC 8743b / DSM 1359 / FGSC 10004 / NBRC 33097 / NRRL 1555) TaxID=763407 RepID=A0A162NKC3_PHYB8|nr:hypothetical protein PHYBLDRAFT_70593 [Phycomyces blakesleeanus NRRL 1555(-)]OAD70484.1 hypothetical protein PHYBLDRAFT_70593 [Phycomyces blakesleeanus NRRL 1555(-)]|eukprot:XP_018288524.1 hypothetical protein PHYBLDRAFT_70593 [Phycomyces blakesleeanus NRRL 1555(-)]
MVIIIVYHLYRNNNFENAVYAELQCKFHGKTGGQGVGGGAVGLVRQGSIMTPVIDRYIGMDRRERSGRDQIIKPYYYTRAFKKKFKILNFQNKWGGHTRKYSSDASASTRQIARVAIAAVLLALSGISSKTNLKTVLEHLQQSTLSPLLH